MKIFLSTPPGRTTELWPPLGLLYIASCIREKRDDEVIVADAFCRNWDGPRLVQEILSAKPDVVGLNCSTHTFLDAVATLREVAEKLPEATIVLGGYHATLATEQILRGYPFIDYIVRGEGERSFVALLDCIEAGRPPAGIPGISFLNEGQYVTAEPELIEDLDALPFPDRSLLGAMQYGYVFQGIPLTFGKFTTMCTSRGCAYDCTYCSCATFSHRRWRYRSAENVVDELELLQRQGYRSVVLIDDNFTQRESRVEEICSLIQERGIRLQLYCEGRVNHARPELLERMKAAGFDVIYFGVESASQRVLDFYRKRATVEQARQAIENAKRARMLVITSFILGAPPESPEDMRRTIEFIRSTRPHGVQLNVLDLLVGTPLWQDLARDGVVGAEDWQTNHRVHEYGLAQLGHAELEALAAEGYNTYLSAWKTPVGAMEIARLALANGTARDIILHNALNRRAAAALVRGIRPPGARK